MPIDDIFRAYDIRGRTDTELTGEVMERIGRAFATDLLDRGVDAAVMGHDVRTTSPALADAFARGATGCGVDMQRAGLVPYGAVLFHGYTNDLPTAYITASHLTKEWNGVKFTDARGVGYLAERNMHIKDLYHAADFPQGSGAVTDTTPLDAYQDHLVSRVDIEDSRVAMDCGNGASSVAAPAIFDAAGVETDTLYDEPDGTFPNRASDVTAESLTALRERVADGAFDCGIAYDGDADRVAVVDETGTVLSAEHVAGVVLEHILPDAPGPVIANVECSRLIEDVASRYDRDVVRVPVGHNHMIQALQEHDGCLALETSRHMSLPHILPVDDGIAASLGAVEAVAALDRSLSAAVDTFPSYVRDRIPFEVDASRKFAIIDTLQDELSQEYDRTNTKDGVRVDLPTGWVLIRASNTSPKIRLTVEAETEADFDALKDEFSGRLEAHL